MLPADNSITAFRAFQGLQLSAVFALEIQSSVFSVTSPGASCCPQGVRPGAYQADTGI